MHAGPWSTVKRSAPPAGSASYASMIVSSRSFGGTGRTSSSVVLSTGCSGSGSIEGDERRFGGLAAAPPAATSSDPSGPRDPVARVARREGERAGVPTQGEPRHERPDPASFLSHRFGPAAVEADVAEKGPGRIEHVTAACRERVVCRVHVPRQAERAGAGAVAQGPEPLDSVRLGGVGDEAHAAL